MLDDICISDGLIGQPCDEMQVIEDDYARDNLIELTLDDTEVDDIGCVLIIDVQFDVVSV